MKPSPRKLSKTTALLAAGAVVGGLALPGCEILESPWTLLALQLLGVTAAPDFRDTGRIHFSLLGEDDDGKALRSLRALGCEVEVENDDGTFNDCDFVDEDHTEASRFNAVAMLVDDSGSMGRSYPSDEYGDLCSTCPHDPNNVRSEAVVALSDIVQERAPWSRLALMDFGPEPDPGLDATRVLQDFTEVPGEVQASVSGLDGTQLVGTPLWDSLADVILMLDTDADDYQDDLMRMWQSGELDEALPSDDEASNESDESGGQGGGDDEQPDGTDEQPGDGSGDTSDGSGDTSDGSGDTSDGSGDIADGSGDTSDGSGDIADGSGDISDGSGDIADGSGDTEDVPTSEAPEVLRYVIVLSDGEDTTSDQHTLDSVIAMANEHGIVIHAVGLGPASADEENPAYAMQGQVDAVADLQRLAAETGGFYASASDPESLVELYQKIADGLTAGVTTETFECLPHTTDSAPMARTVARGEQVSGRISLGGFRLPWTILAP